MYNYDLSIIEHQGWFFIYIGLMDAAEEDRIYLGYSAYVDKLMDEGIFMTHDNFERAADHMERAKEWFKFGRTIKKPNIPNIHK